MCVRCCSLSHPVCCSLRDAWLCSAKPESECKNSNFVSFICTRYGSHCAHLRSWWPYKYSWLDIVVPEYFRAVLAQSRQKVPEQPQVTPNSLQFTREQSSQSCLGNFGDLKAVLLLQKALSLIMGVDSILARSASLSEVI